MNDVVWLGRGYWDMQLLEDLFIKKNHHSQIGKLKEAIVVCPTEYQDVNELNKKISNLKRCILICTSDEENKLDLSKIKHDNIQIYATYVHKTDADVKWLPIGYTPHSKTKGWLEKDIDVLFAGQVNHDSRKKMIRAISDIPTVELDISRGFSQGLEPKDYTQKMQRAKVVPAPRGNISPDSFRLYEALEHGAAPVAENREFFDVLFKDYPFPVITDYKQWRGYVEDALKGFPVIQNTSTAWWMRYKEHLFSDFNHKDDVTIVIPVSPIKSHPQTTILDETIRSIRKHLDCRIIVTFDGVRSEQEYMKDDYQLFINNFLASGHDRIYPLIFDSHMHQTGMMKEALQHIDTDLILYIEQDTPLTEDREIDWELCKQALKSGESNLIRFHFEAFVPKEHKHMMIGEAENNLLKTAQWSQRPHLATTAFYRRVMNEYFSEEARSFIEDHMHGKLWNAYELDGEQGWNQFRVHIYHPKGDIKRSYHTDGRAGEAKFDDTQVF